MNISLKNNNTVSGVLKVEIVKSDYDTIVEKNLRTLRQKATVPGFRKGMVPQGLVKKMYGKQVLVEEVNKLVSENIVKYIQENKLNILGEPLPNQTEQQTIDFDTQEDFDFYFDLAFAPEIKIVLNKEDQLPYLQVAVTEEMLNQQIDSYRKNYGSYDLVEDVMADDLLKGTIAELEDGTPKEGGIVVENAVLMPRYINNEEEQAKFIGATKDSVIVFNPQKAFEGGAAEIASLLKVSKEEAHTITSDFSFEIKEITRHKEADLSPELYDKVFGDGVITSEEAFREAVKASIAEQYTPQSDYLFLKDARTLLLEKAGEIAFDDALLKRWLLFANENNTPESVEEDYPKVVEDLKFHLAKESILKDNQLTVEESDINQLAERVAKAQFAQYGMLSLPQDVLENYAKDLMKNKETRQNIIDRAVENKLASWIKGQVTLEVKELSTEEFAKLMN